MGKIVLRLDRMMGGIMFLFCIFVKKSRWKLGT